MKCVIPSTSVRTKFLKSLPVGTIYKDPRNNHSYEVQEYKVNSTLTKIGYPYFGSNEPTIIDVPEEFLKLENPVRPNANQALKAKIVELESRIINLGSNDCVSDSTNNSLEEVNQALRSKILDLEETVKQLQSRLDNSIPTTKPPNLEQSLFNKIIKLMNGNEIYETDNELFEVGKDLVFYLKKKDKGNSKEQMKQLKELTWKDPNVIYSIMEQQPIIQKKLLKYLMKDFSDEKIVEIKKH